MKIREHFTSFEKGKTVVRARIKGNTVGGKHIMRITIDNAKNACFWGNVLGQIASECRYMPASKKTFKRIGKMCEMALRGGSSNRHDPHHQDRKAWTVLLLP